MTTIHLMATKFYLFRPFRARTILFSIFHWAVPNAFDITTSWLHNSLESHSLKQLQSFYLVLFTCFFPPAIGIVAEIPQKSVGKAMARGIVADSPTRCGWKCYGEGIAQIKKMPICHILSNGIFFDKTDSENKINYTYERKY